MSGLRIFFSYQKILMDTNFLFEFETNYDDAISQERIHRYEKLC